MAIEMPTIDIEYHCYFFRVDVGRRTKEIHYYLVIVAIIFHFELVTKLTECRKTIGITRVFKKNILIM